MSADWDLTTGQEEEEETAVATSAVPEGFAFSKQAGTKEQKPARRNLSSTPA